jgi:hypothetical protein
MTAKEMEAELTREPFVPLRLHLVSGKSVEVPRAGVAWLMQNAVLVFQNAKVGRAMVDGYDVIALRNIERVEQRVGRRKKAG